jgi:hypothetical protein
MSELSRMGIDNQAVHDISLLPDTKLRITAALLQLMRIANEEETKTYFRTGIIVLAFFQPDVGATAVDLDQMGPQQQTWQEVVDLERRDLSETLIRLGYGLD